MSATLTLPDQGQADQAESSSPTPEQPIETTASLACLADRIKESNAFSSLLAVFDQGMISGTNFLTAIVVGRYCDAETLGIYALVAAALAMIIGVQDQLITSPFVMYHNRRRGATLQKYSGSVVAHQLIFVLLCGVTFSGAILLQVGSGQLAETVMLVLFAAMPGVLLRAFAREIALADCNMLTVVLIDAGVCCVQLVIVGVMVTTGSVNLPTIYAAIGVACTVTAAIWFRVNGFRFRFDAYASFIAWQRNWRFGRWALATHLAGTSTPYIMPWVLFFFHGEKSTGYLASCSVIVGVANILLAGMADFLTPKAAAAYAKGGLDELRTILRSMLGLSVLAIGSVCVVAAVFGEQAINLLYDGRFQGAGPLVVLLTLAVLCNAIGNVAGNGLWALDQPRANFVADVATMTVAIAAAPIFVQPYGAWGAAAASLSASAFGAMFRQLIFFQAIKQRQARIATV